MKKILVGLIVFASMSMLAAPNPASVYCVDKMKGISSDFGGRGLCRLSDDSLIAEWTLYRTAKKSPQIASKKFLEASWDSMDGSYYDWAAIYCNKVGGKVEKVYSGLRFSVSYDLCTFSDNSSIEIWTLFAGRQYFPKLAKSLESAK